MLEDYSVPVFPTNEYQALALLYMESLDITGMTPEGVADAYLDAYQRIEKRFKEKCDENIEYL